MKTRLFDWSSIPNIVIRGKKRLVSARVQLNGKQVWRRTGIQADPGGENADDVRAWMRAFQVELVKDSDKLLQLTRSRDEHSTFADVFAAYRTACTGRDIVDTVVERNISWLTLIIRTVKGITGTQEEITAQVGALRVTVLTPDLLADFQSARIAAVKARAKDEAWDAERLENKIKSTNNTVKSAIQQARSLFARELLQSRHYRDLELPDLRPFMEFKADGSTIASYVPLPVDVWNKIVADLPELKKISLAQWFAFWLGANAGLRRRSARNARWAWFTEQPDGSATMDVRVAKGNHYTGTLSPAVWTAMKEAKSSTDYIIPLGTEEERDQAIVDVGQWMRARGVTQEMAKKPFHHLRKAYGALMHQTHGLTTAQNALGHGSHKLTDAVYVEHKSTQHVQLVG